MNVPLIVDRIDAQDYLSMIVGTVQADIAPLLQATGGAPHAVAREVFCYVDHLGHLYTGDPSDGMRTRAYLRDVLSVCDRGYASWSNELREMFRNGPVHEFDPKIVTDGEHELAWLSYRGNRTDTVNLGTMRIELTHLTPIQLDAETNRWHLPLSGPCLVRDLVDSVEHLGEAIDPPKWNRAAASLNKPKPVVFAAPFWTRESGTSGEE